MNRISDALIIGSILAMTIACGLAGLIGTGPASLPPWMP